MLNSTLLTLMENDSAVTPLTTLEILVVMGHATLLGFILTFTTYFIGTYLERAILKTRPSGKNLLEDVISATNLLFMTVGLCGVMLLISNNLLRALAVMASIAIVRFRVRLDYKTLGSAMLFAVLAGMACGAQELAIAYVTVGVFVLLATILSLSTKVISLQLGKSNSMVRTTSPNSPANFSNLDTTALPISDGLGALENSDLTNFVSLPPLGLGDQIEFEEFDSGAAIPKESNLPNQISPNLT